MLLESLVQLIIVGGLRGDGFLLLFYDRRVSGWLGLWDCLVDLRRSIHVKTVHGNLVIHDLPKRRVFAALKKIIHLNVLRLLNLVKWQTILILLIILFHLAVLIELRRQVSTELSRVLNMLFVDLILRLFLSLSSHDLTFPVNILFHCFPGFECLHPLLQNVSVLVI